MREWRDSCVSDAITTANVRCVEGDEAVDLLTAEAISKMGGWAQQYATGKVIKLRKRYEHAGRGGWWVSGLDPLNDWAPMEWGQLKPNHPREKFKRLDDGTYEATGNHVKYEAPAGTVTRAFFADITRVEIAALCNRYHLNVDTVIEEIEQCQKGLGISGRQICLTASCTPGIRDGGEVTTPLSSSSRNVTSAELRQNCRYSDSLSRGQLSHSAATQVTEHRYSESREKALLWTYPGFWEWIKQHPEIPILICEGAKKAGAALTAGYAAIALPGVYNGYRSKDALGNPITPTLIPDIEAITGPKRPILLAFDQDDKAQTRRHVAIAITRFGQLLTQADCQVNIVRWSPKDGKGIDDLIANHGADAFHTAVQRAFKLDEFQLWQALENRLSIAPTIAIKTHDLTALQPESVPNSGIVAIASAKGTGKTNLMGGLLAGKDKALLAGHRISLMRNLSERCGVNYRGDLDKQDGRFITGNGYTLRVGTCVDSLLAIDPNSFEGCDLVLDEVCQVLRHLLTSSTCNKQGKRPVLLMRFRELLQAARRVIIADADLDDKAINYIQQLRGDTARPFLIRNDYKAPGYSVRFIESPDASAITGELLADLKAGLRVYIATDSKRASKRIHKLINELQSDIPSLLINSETSGGDIERAFMENPDQHLSTITLQAVTASPSAGTGISIEGNHFDRVYGLFYGGSINDADMAQALGRVRANVPRVVWCTQHGSAFSKAGRENSALKLRNLLKQKTDANTLLIRSSLSELASDTASAYDWANDPHIGYWSQIEAERNRSMWNLRTALKIRLMHEGHTLQIKELASNQNAKVILKQAREDLKIERAVAIESAANLTPAEAKALDELDGLDEAQRLALEKWQIAEFYCVPVAEVEADLVLWDSDGRRRGQLRNLEQFLNPELATDADVRALEKQAQWQTGSTPWDLSNAALKQEFRKRLGLSDYLESGKKWTGELLAEFKAKALGFAAQVKAALNFSVSKEMPAAQMLNQLLEQIGVECQSKQHRQNGQRVRTYSVDESIQRLNLQVIERRKARRERLNAEAVTPPSFNDLNTGGCDTDKAPEIADSAVVVSLADGYERIGGAVDVSYVSISDWNPAAWGVSVPKPS